MNLNLSCPICAGNCSLLDVVDFNKSCEEANGKFLPHAGIPIYYTRCNTCGFCFAPEIAAWDPDEFSKRIYNDEYVIVDPDYVELRPRINAANLIALFGDRAHAIKHLDYGSGAGLLAKLLQESNWQSSSYDPFVDRGTHIEQLGKFDLITAFEVFEHVPNVLDLMTNLRALLAPNGLVLFSTLLSDGHINPDQRINWWYASPRNGHISLFSLQSLKMLAQKYGFNFGSFDAGEHIFFTNLPTWAKHLEKLITVNTLAQQPELQSLQQAIALHQAGQLQEAGEIYLAILKTQPNHPEANYNLGMIAVQANQPAAGLPYFMAALDADPSRGQYWVTYIDALCQAGQLEDARQILALARQQGLEGNEVDALAQRLEDSSQAAEPANVEFQDTLNESSNFSFPGTKNSAKNFDNNPLPEEIDTLVTLFSEGKQAEAATLAKSMTKRFPQHWFGWKALGVVFQKMGQSEAALEPMQKALALAPGDAEVHNNLGNILKDLGRFDEAEASLRRALEIRPDYAQAHCNLAAILHDMGRLEEAKAFYRRAIELKPDLAEAHNNLGNTLLDLGQLEDAEASCRRALEIKPDYSMAHHNLSVILLTMGRLSEGWPEYEYRRKSFSSKHLLRPDTDLPQWKGQIPLPGDRLLIFREQGLGDQIQFSRYLPLAANRFTNCISLVAAPPLLTLLRRSFPNVEVMDTDPADQSPWQWHCSMLSLPLAFDTKLETIPNHVPYLIPDPAKVTHWQSRITALALPASTRKIGVVWKPGSGMKNASFRALTLQQLEPLLNLPGCAWFSLQKEPDPDKGPFVASGKLVDWADEFSDFDDTAALVANLDLVISVDTSVAHLAGGLGKPVWLFNRHASEWRWMRDREDSPWYPTMRIFTQKTAGDWDEGVARMVDALRQTDQSEAAPPSLAVEHTPPRALKQPGHHEIDALLSLFGEGRFTEAASLAKEMTERFPLHEFGWKALGAILKQSGRDAEALAPMQKAAALAPDDEEAHYNLGVTLQQLDRLNEAEASFRQALQLRPDYAEAHCSMGNTLLDLVQPEEAEACCRRALEIRPDFAGAHNNLGNALRQMGRLHEAEACFRQALQLQPGLAVAHSNLGATLLDLGRPAEAEACCRRALEIRPDFAEAINNLGSALQQLGKLPESEVCFRQALQLKPDYAEAYSNMGGTLLDLDRPEEAEACCRRALEIRPDFAEALNNLGNTLRQLGRLHEAEACLRQALQLKPDYFEAYSNMSATLLDRGRPAEAESSCRRALEIRPDYPKAHHNLCLILLTMGRLSEGWPEYEYRWDTFSQKRLPRPKTDLPLWKGQTPLAGDRLLVFKEQGLGDQLQFSRYLPLAAKRFTQGVSAVVDTPLLALFRRSFPGVDFLDHHPADQPGWQWQCPMLSLPLAFNTTLDTIPHQVPYLIPDTVKVSHWHARIAALGLSDSVHKVGIVWKPGNAMKNAAFRALSLQQLGPLLNLPGCAWFSLQREPDPDKAPFVASGRLVDWVDEFGSFDDTAALVANLDLVISVDTSVAHLAGGLGKPVWLFNRHASEWRWMRDREDSPWYPTMRIFTQKTAGDWDEGVARMVDALRQTDQSEAAPPSLAVEHTPPRALKQPGHHDIDALLSLFGEGRLAEAADLAQSMTERFPLHEFGWKALGAILKQLGHDAEALAPMQKAAELAPDDEEAHYNLGVTLQQLDRLNEAEACYRQALRINPAYGDAYSNLGTLLQDLGRLDEAESCHRSALKIRPDNAVAYNNLGVTLQALNHLGEAESCYRRALQIMPDNAEALNNLGITLHELGRLDEAESCYRRTLQVKPDDTDAHNYLGTLLKDRGQLDEAEACFRRALEIKPDDAKAYNNLGNIRLDQGQLDEAEACYRKALEIEPHYFLAHSNLLFSLNYASSKSPADCLAEAIRYGQNIKIQVTSPFTEWSCAKQPERLRVGFVSGDFNNHPVGYFLENLLHQFDTTAIECIAYPTTTKTDELTARIKPLFSAWKPLSGLKDEAAAHLIHEDGVHILIDLSGHSAHNRLPVFAWKPAPVQASWLGYFATTGVTEIDYLIADPWTLPESEAVYFTEKIWRLPETRLCFAPPDSDLEVSALPALTNGYITFCCFNNLTKMNEDVVALWSRLLLSVPDSRLFLKSRQLDEAAVRQRAIEHFAGHGIEAGRLILEGYETREEYLAAYQRVDIALDPFPFPGGTTSAEGLWMGVPVMTLAGERFLSRQGAGILMNAGLPDWIARDKEEYVSRASAHAADLNRLSRLRHELRQQALASPFMDGRRFARHFRDALIGMYQAWYEREKKSG